MIEDLYDEPIQGIPLLVLSAFAVLVLIVAKMI